MSSEHQRRDQKFYATRLTFREVNLTNPVFPELVEVFNFLLSLFSNRLLGLGVVEANGLNLNALVGSVQRELFHGFSSLRPNEVRHCQQ